MIEAIKCAGKLIESKVKGKKWVDEALSVIMKVAKEIKELEEKKKGETDPLQELINDIRTKYAGELQVLGEIDERIRTRIMKEYEGTESIKQEGIGELVFPELWSFEVVDIKKVPVKFHTVDAKAINIEIRKGIRNIKGIEIKKRRSLQVRPHKDNND